MSVRGNGLLLKEVCLLSLFPTASMHRLGNQGEGVEMATFNFIPDYFMGKIYFPFQLLGSKGLVVLMLKGEILCPRNTVLDPLQEKLRLLHGQFELFIQFTRKAEERVSVLTR